jgi:hypothetical protein
LSPHQSSHQSIAAWEGQADLEAAYKIDKHSSGTYLSELLSITRTHVLMNCFAAGHTYNAVRPEKGKGLLSL